MEDNINYVDKYVEVSKLNTFKLSIKHKRYDFEISLEFVRKFCCNHIPKGRYEKYF